MNKFDKRIDKLDSKRIKAENKLSKVSSKLESKAEAIKMKVAKVAEKARMKQEKVLSKFASKNGVSYEVVLERYNQLQEAKKAKVLDKKITKKLVK